MIKVVRESDLNNENDFSKTIFYETSNSEEISSRISKTINNLKKEGLVLKHLSQSQRSQRYNTKPIYTIIMVFEKEEK